MNHAVIIVLYNNNTSETTIKVYYYLTYLCILDFWEIWPWIYSSFSHSIYIIQIWQQCRGINFLTNKGKPVIICLCILSKHPIIDFLKYCNIKPVNREILQYDNRGKSYTTVNSLYLVCCRKSSEEIIV